jgi:hypothetical protein
MAPPSRRLTASFTVDPSAASVLILCRDCSWRHLARTRVAARAAAVTHTRTVHPAQLTAAQANLRAQTYRERHAPTPD